MRVPAVLFKCVGFIGEVTHEDSSGVSGDLLATGFIVSVPSSIPHESFAYFVTAKHVAKDLEDRHSYVLVNKRGGGVTPIKLLGSWWFHPTDFTADVAIRSIGIDPVADYMAIMSQDFVTEQDIATEIVGVGDEVFATGLFTAAPGASRNLPIVRHGNLAMIPTEQIQTELGYADVYLVEARSIGGLSGSPVWVRPSLEMQMRHGAQVVPANVVGPGKLLGLMHGHWDIRESEMNKASIVHDRAKGVNLGIGIVAPATKILDTLNQTGLQDLRKENDDSMRKQSIPGTDSAKPKRLASQKTVTGLEIPVPTNEQFFGDLKKASRKKESGSK